MLVKFNQFGGDRAELLNPDLSGHHLMRIDVNKFSEQALNGGRNLGIAHRAPSSSSFVPMACGARLPPWWGQPRDYAGSRYLRPQVPPSRHVEANGEYG